MPSSVFFFFFGGGGIEYKNKNLPASSDSVFQKSGLRNTCLIFFSLNEMPYKTGLKIRFLNVAGFLEKSLKKSSECLNEGLPIKMA